MSLSFGRDWIVFSLAVRAFLQGHSPYLVGEGYYKVFEPFWTYLILSPLILLPFQWGGLLHIVISLASYMYTAVRLGATRMQLILFLTSGTVIGSLYFGNIDWLIMSGLWMPPQIGLFFVMMKPQVGICVAAYWAYAAWKQGGWRQLAKVFAPVTIAYLISFWMYGLWLFQLHGMENNPASVSIFPILIPVAVYLMYKAIRQQDGKLAALSSPMIAPYVSPSNFSVILLNLFNRPKLFLFVWAALWVLTIINTIR
jgi:hypothetical protein